MNEIKEKANIDLWIKLFTAALICISLLVGVMNQSGVRFAADIYPLLTAVNDYTHGIDPYRHMAQSMFVYHPVVLKVLVGLNSLMPLSYFFITFYALIITWFIYQSYLWLFERLPEKESESDRCIWIFLISLSFGGVVLASLLCGNLSPYFHLILVGLIFNYSRKKNVLTLGIFGIIVVCFAIVKPYLLAYLLFYFLILKKSRAFVLSVFLSICVAMIWLSAMYLQPAEFEHFSSALQYQLLIKDDLGGFSTLRLMIPSIGLRAGFLLHLGIVGIILYVMLVIGPVKVTFMKNVNNQLLVLLLLIIFINPRLVFYDFFIAVFILFYLVYINFPKKYILIILPGFLLSIISQIVVHPTRWLILSYGVVVVTFAITVSRSRIEGDETKTQMV
jgi:hypothetical protein